MSRQLLQRLKRLEKPQEGGTMNIVISGWRYVGNPGGCLKVPVIQPEDWGKLAA